jgi:hypothetical protein
MPRAATLTVLTATSALAAAVQVSAATVEDRYGPPHSAPVHAALAEAAPIAAPAAAPVAAPVPAPAPAPARIAVPVPAPAPVAAATPAAAPPTNWLAWSMKTPAAQAKADAPAAPASAPQRLASAALPTSLHGPHPSPAGAMVPVSAPTPVRSAPVSPAAATPPAPDPGPTSNGPRFYSVHRQFGLRPDPIPLPKQFFADNTPDLAAPPPPLPPRPVPGTQAASSPANTASNRARQVEIETADSAAN